MPTGAFNICCPRDAVSRTANVERAGRHKWANYIFIAISNSFSANSFGQWQCFIFYFPLKAYARLHVSSTKFHIYLCCVRRCYAWQFCEYAHWNLYTQLWFIVHKYRRIACYIWQVANTTSSSLWVSGIYTLNCELVSDLSFIIIVAKSLSKVSFIGIIHGLIATCHS